jgi:hypothetical protein
MSLRPRHTPAPAAGRSRLWQVLNAGLHAAPTGVAGEKRKRSDMQPGSAGGGQGSADGGQGSADEMDDDESSGDQSPWANKLSDEDVALLTTNMTLTMTIAPWWKPEWRDFSHRFQHENVPLVSYSSEWPTSSLPELHSGQGRVGSTGSVQASGTLDGILLELMNGGADGRPSLLDAGHYAIHLAACQKAISENPELMNNLGEKFRGYIQNGDNLLFNLIFVYNAISSNSSSSSIVSKWSLLDSGLTDLDIFRFWHQLRALLYDLESETTVARRQSDDSTLGVAGFVSDLLYDVDPRSADLDFLASQPY